ncbi:Uncharacterised protein [Candidatus Burarchaeum australiense]|nr:Uncharacterised protein [Candidatus Burarchaeum australiense]
MELETSVAALKEAENKAASTLGDANERKEERLKEARNRAAAIVDKAHDEAEKLKDAQLAEGRTEIGKETKAIAAKAKAEADKVRKTSVPAGTAEKVAKKVFKDIVG